MPDSKQSSRIRHLAEKLQAGTITLHEQKEFDEWYNSAENTLEISTSETFDEMEARLYNAILIKAGIRQRKVHQLWPRAAAAASVLFIIAIGGYFISRKQPQLQVNNSYHIVPGSNKAVLTLANGDTINLTDVKSGIIANENGILVQKSDGGEISYDNHASIKPPATIAYNIISTPRGGQWPVVILPDGTKAVLDASSSIKYPVSFTGAVRSVEITGQVYFDVVHNAARPFKVIAGNQVIEDIGTQFNVNSYTDEPAASTTLVEGAVKITVANKSVFLKPGQRAIVNKESNEMSVAGVNAEEMIDWKNGQISFKNKNIQEIMRQVSRWYDVDIEYRGNLPDRKFTGGISRKAGLSELLKILEFNGIYSTVTGKIITLTFSKP